MADFTLNKTLLISKGLYMFLSCDDHLIILKL